MKIKLELCKEILRKILECALDSKYCFGDSVLDLLADEHREQKSNSFITTAQLNELHLIAGQQGTAARYASLNE